MSDFGALRLFSKIRFAVVVIAMSAIAGCGGGGGGGGSTGCPGGYISCSGSTGSGSSGSGTTTTATPTLTLALVDATTNQASTSLTTGKPLKVIATVTSPTGALLSGKLVTFTSSAPTLAVLDPASGTRLTGSDGTASITVLAANVTAEGAGRVTVSADIDGTIVTGSAAYSVSPGTLSLQNLAAASASLGAYGSTSVSVKVLLNGVTTSETQVVSFISSCASATPAKATLTPTVATVNGVATATYTDNGCAGDDTITASIQGTTAQVRITVAPPQASNVSFISATPASIVLAGTGGDGLSSDSVVTFKVVDGKNAPMASKKVNFDLSTRVGGIKLNSQASGIVQGTSDASGLVGVTVSAGTVPTPVWVIATLDENSAIRSLSPNLTISTGRPTQDRFSLAVDTFNIEGWLIDGKQTDLTVHAYDRLGNPVPNGTVVNFISEGAGVQPSCNTTDGACSVKFTSANFRPSNGRVTVLAYAQGEESFDDLNTNNTWDANEPFRDLGDAFIDNNEDGAWQSGEREIAFNAANTSACPAYPADGRYYNAPYKANTCDGQWGSAHVRRTAVITLSSANIGSLSPSTFNTQGCSGAFTFRVADENNNPLPAGTTISAITDTLQWLPSIDVAYTKPVVPDKVPNTSALGGTFHTLFIDTKCSGSSVTGTVTLQLTTPANVVSYRTIVIQ
ncbi:hypothetical protein [Zoogloea sp.]|uniref:hypothetical protein n=1 Tax=Zoogloea sp. TaxID=49181 RepID=UPI0035B3557B